VTDLVRTLLARRPYVSEGTLHAIAEQRISRVAAAGHQPDLFAGVAA